MVTNTKQLQMLMNLKRLVRNSDIIHFVVGPLSVRAIFDFESVFGFCPTTLVLSFLPVVVCNTGPNVAAAHCSEYDLQNTCCLFYQIIMFHCRISGLAE